MKTVLLMLGCVLMAHGVRAEISCPTAVVHRRAAASAISNPILFEKAVADGLKDHDPMIRRYALVALNEKNPERAKAAAKGLTADESAAVRKVAKMLCREGGLYRENIARSTDPLYDHAVTVRKKVRVTDGAFSLDAAVPPESWVEINLGKPKEDLYVWLNGTYLGQYDIDNDEGKPFRLDATKEFDAACREALGFSMLSNVVRGMPGQAVAIMPQGISYRTQVAPRGKAEPEVLPSWATSYPKANYITSPRDLLLEAYWTIFSRRVDGIGAYA